MIAASDQSKIVNLFFHSVRITGKFHGHTFIDQDFQYPLGECTEIGLPEGVDRALKRFRIGEKSLIVLKVSDA